MGGFDKLREAGVALLGGHTVQDREIKFGYAVTGAIDPARVLTNAGAKSGDVLFLTKPLGTGIVGTAIKFERAPEALASEAIASMRTLNRAAADAIRSLPADAVHACTDITGFGLIGHASALAKASGVTLDIHADRLPLFDGVLPLASGNRSGGLGSNQEHFSPSVLVTAGVDASLEILLYDPQTSGGLLVAVADHAADELAGALKRAGVQTRVIGSVRPAIRDVLIRVVPHV
jgi:selenide,water dikinase